MNLILTIVEIFLVISIVLTAMSEPKLSFEYGKSLLVSTVKAINWVIKVVKEVMENQKNKDIEQKATTLPTGQQSG